VNPLTPIYYLK